MCESRLPTGGNVRFLGQILSLLKIFYFETELNKAKRRCFFISTIYKISNAFNDKVYIGKTAFSLNKRFKEHCNDSTKTKLQHRPLYRDMQKYGIENFSIHFIESVPEEIADSREKFWINYYNSSNDGYNITLGGKGKKFIDSNKEQEVINTYLALQNVSKTASKLKISYETIVDICLKNDIPIKSTSEVNKIQGKEICMYDKDTESFILEFSSIKDASAYIKENYPAKSEKSINSHHISECAHGKRKSAYGYIWKFK